MTFNSIAVVLLLSLPGIAFGQTEVAPDDEPQSPDPQEDAASGETGDETEEAEESGEHSPELSEGQDRGPDASASEPSAEPSATEPPDPNPESAPCPDCDDGPASSPEPEFSEEDWDDGASYGMESGPPSAESRDGTSPQAAQQTEQAEPESSGEATAYMQLDVLRVGGSVQHLGQAQLELLEYDDPHSVFTQVPGVYVRHEDGFGLRPNIGLRGANPERSRRVTLLEDDVLFGPAPYSAPAAYYFPLMTRVVGLDVFKGPAALLYGPQTVGGAINLRMRRVPRDSGGEIDLSYGRFNARKIHLHWGTSNRWGGFLFEALDVASTGFKEIDGPDGQPSDLDTGFWRTDFMARGFLQTNPSGHLFSRFELKLGFQRERSNETYLGLSDEDFAQNPDRRYAASADDHMAWWRTQAVLRWRLSVGEAFEMTTDLYRHDFSRSWDRLAGFEGADLGLRDILLAPTGARAVYYNVLHGADSDPADGTQLLRTRNQRAYISEGLQTRARLRFRTGVLSHVIELGARAHYDSIERRHLGTVQGQVSGRLVSEGVGTLATNNDGSTLAGSAYLVYSLDAFGFTLRPGIRTEVIHTRLKEGDGVQEETRAIALPGVGLAYAVMRDLSVVGGVHRGFSPVAPGQPAEVEPETSIAYELGARYFDQEEGHLLELIGFVNDYDNLTGQCAFSAGCRESMLDTQSNAGAVVVWGVEAAASWTFDLGHGFSVPARLTYTYTGSRFQTAFESFDPTFGDVEEGDVLPSIPTHQGQVQVGIAHVDAGAQMVLNWTGETREQAGQGEILPGQGTDGYVTLDVVGWAQLTPSVRLYGQFQNLTNARPIVSRRPFGARPLRPLTASVGIKIAVP